MVIDRTNKVWATDITYIPMAKGFVYLCAIIDWHSRKVLSYGVSISQYGTPEIFHTDQGSQFICERFTNVLKQHGIQISMDGRNRWMDNVMIERLWRTVKYEEVYLKGYPNVREAKTQLSAYFEFYNHRRLHSSLDAKNPDEVYYGKVMKPKAA